MISHGFSGFDPCSFNLREGLRPAGLVKFPPYGAPTKQDPKVGVSREGATQVQEQIQKRVDLGLIWRRARMRFSIGGWLANSRRNPGGSLIFRVARVGSSRGS